MMGIPRQIRGSEHDHELFVYGSRNQRHTISEQNPGRMSSETHTSYHPLRDDAIAQREEITGEKIDQE